MSKIINVGGTRFRSDHIAWVIRQGLSRRERLCKVCLLLMGPIFFLSLAHAKGDYWTLEAVLSLVPVLVALGIRTTARLASSGDSAEMYEERLVQPGREFEQAAGALRDECVEVVSVYGNYHYMLNPARIHWYRSWFHMNFRPLRVFWIFGIYAGLIASHFGLPTWPGLAELKMFVYLPGTSQQLLVISSILSVLGLLTVASSYKRGLKLGSHGGVVERLFLYPTDRDTILAAIDKGWS